MVSLLGDSLEKKKDCRIAGFKEPIPIIMLLGFLKEDKYEKSDS